MTRRVHALALATAATVAGGCLVAAQGAAADPSGRSIDDPGAWVNRTYVAFDGASSGHGGSGGPVAHQYGPGRWESLYQDETQTLQNLHVAPGPAGAVTATAIPLGEGSSWGGAGAFDVDPVTGDAVVCGVAGSPSQPVFVTRHGADGAWSAPRTATLPAERYAGAVACAVSGSRVVVASATSTAEPNDYYGARTVGSAAATTSTTASGDIALVAFGPTRFANTAGFVQGSGAESASTVSAGASGSELVVGTAVAGVNDLQDGVARYSSATSLTRFPSEGTATVRTLHTNTYGSYPSGSPDASAPTLADLGGAVLATDAHGAYRVTDDTVEQVVDGTHADGSPRYTVRPVPQSAPGTAWVVQYPEPDAQFVVGAPTLHRVTTSGHTTPAVPAETGFDDAEFAWGLQNGWGSATAPDGSLWFDAGCVSNGNTSYACLVRWTAAGTRVGRIEATAHDPLPFSATTGEGLRIDYGRNPNSYHFDSETPVDNGPVSVNFARYDGAVNYYENSAQTLSIETTDPTVANAYLTHRWTVNGTQLPDQDFGPNSSNIVSYTFPAVGDYTVTHQARDAAGNTSSVTTTVVKVVDPSTPLANLGPVAGIQVTQTAMEGGGVTVGASWTATTGADAYQADVLTAQGESVQSSYVDDGTTSTTLDVYEPGASALTLRVTPYRSADGAGLPGTTAFTLIGEAPDTTAPTGTYTVAPTTAWKGYTKVTLKQTALADDRDAKADLTREVNWGDGSGWNDWTSPATALTTTRTFAKAGTFTPQVRLSDVAGNQRTVTLTKVTVRADTVKPTLTLTRPPTASLPAVSAWRVLKGPAKDAQTRLNILYVYVVQKRGSLYYGYNYSLKKWSKGQTTLAKAKNLVWPQYPTASSTGAWSAPAIVGLTKGTIYVYASAFDAANNRTDLVVTQVLTR